MRSRFGRPGSRLIPLASIRKQSNVPAGTVIVSRAATLKSMWTRPRGFPPFEMAYLRGPPLAHGVLERLVLARRHLAAVPEPDLVAEQVPDRLAVVEGG